MVTAAVTWESPSALISRTTLVVFYGISTILQIFRFPISAVLETIIACPSSAYFRPFSETFKGKVMTGAKIGQISYPLFLSPSLSLSLSLGRKFSIMYRPNLLLTLPPGGAFPREAKKA